MSYVTPRATRGDTYRFLVAYRYNGQNYEYRFFSRLAATTTYQDLADRGYNPSFHVI